jgi:RNA polymerase sigma factor (sigma-70 family)
MQDTVAHQDTDTDAYLIQACQQGDPDAWERVLSRYERLVYSAALHCDLDPDEAADVVQYTFIALLKGMNHFHGTIHLGAWLWTVARRQAWRLAKKRRAHVSLDILDVATLREAAQFMGRTDDALESWELSVWLQSGLNQLKPRCQKLLLALYFEPEPPAYTDIAKRFDMPLGAIGPTRLRCLSELRKVLQGLMKTK